VRPSWRPCSGGCLPDRNVDATPRLDLPGGWRPIIELLRVLLKTRCRPTTSRKSWWKRRDLDNRRPDDATVPR